VVLGGAAVFLLYACGLNAVGENASSPDPSAGATATSTGTGGAGGGATSAAGGMGGAGGAGGAGGGAGGMGGAGGAGGTVGYMWTADNPTKGPGGMGGAGGGGPSECAMYAYVLPAWLKFESPTAGRSTQLSDDSLCVGFNADEARARNVFPKAAAKWGLSVETLRTNNVLQSDSWRIQVNQYGWIPSQSNASENLDLSTNELDPNVSGPNDATKFSTTMVPYPSGQHSRYFLVNGRVISTWVRGQGVASPGCVDPQTMTDELCYAHFRHKDAAGLYANVKSDKWHRLSLVNSKSEAAALVLETRDVPMGAGVLALPVSFVAYGAQAESTGAYPSSYIRTGDMPVTRAAERLFSTDTEKLLPNGYFKVTMKVAPNFNVSATLNEQTPGEYNLLYLDPDNRLYLKEGDRKLYLEVTKVKISSAALSFAREQELTITIESREGKPISLTVEGADDGNGTFTGDVAGPVNTSLPLYILGNEMGAQECSDLRFIQFD
jgi:hypothetical protein